MRLAADGSVSLLIHVAVVTGAIYATQSVRPAGVPAALGATIVAITPEELRYASTPPPDLDVPVKESQTVTVPAVFPMAIPPVNLQQRLDRKDFVSARIEVGTVPGITPVADQPYNPNLVDDPPILLSSGPLVSALVPQAGISSRVVVQAVIDTAGHAEPASVRVIQSEDTAFDQHAQQWMLTAQWRPARVAGHPVRLWVNRAIDYTIIASH